MARRQLAEREAALREWIRAFDVSAYLMANGLTEPEIGILRSLLRP